jgi:hypothetical protein
LQRLGDGFVLAMAHRSFDDCKQRFPNMALFANSSGRKASRSENLTMSDRLAANILSNNIALFVPGRIAVKN